MEEHIMQRDEKNMQTRRKIMASAVHEFALHGYEAASMNTICQQGDISKGIIYHYFESKEALYLACVLECFQALTNVLQDKIMTSPETASSKKTASDGDALLDLYFKTRLDFFHQHADYARIFCGAVIIPPPKLRDEIRRIRMDFDALNDACFLRILAGRHLRKDLNKEQATLLFHRLQDFLNACMAALQNNEPDIEKHEDGSRMMLDIFFNGILERK